MITQACRAWRRLAAGDAAEHGGRRRARARGGGEGGRRAGLGRRSKQPARLPPAADEGMRRVPYGAWVDTGSPLAYCHRRGVHALALAGGGGGGVDLLLSGSEEPGGGAQGGRRGGLVQDTSTSPVGAGGGVEGRWRDRAVRRGGEGGLSPRRDTGRPPRDGGGRVRVGVGGVCGTCPPGSPPSPLLDVVCPGHAPDTSETCVALGAGLPVLDLESGLTEAIATNYLLHPTRSAEELLRNAKSRSETTKSGKSRTLP